MQIGQKFADSEEECSVTFSRKITSIFVSLQFLNNQGVNNGNILREFQRGQNLKDVTYLSSTLCIIKSYCQLHTVILVKMQYLKIWNTGYINWNNKFVSMVKTFTSRGTNILNYINILLPENQKQASALHFGGS